jgi:flavin-dependent dehydrogenase
MSAVCDCLVLGDGITGATFAALIAKAGYRTVLISCGEKGPANSALSLMPAALSTLQRLEVVDALRRGDCPKKLGVRWCDYRGEEVYSVYFCDYGPYESAQTWQVRRDELEEMLVQQARKRGVAHFADLKKLEPMWDGARLVGMLCEREEGGEYEQYARVTLDLAGLTKKHAPSTPADDAACQRVMVSGMYRGALREVAADEGTSLLFQTQRRDGWFRYIPLADNMVSIGAIGDWRAEDLRDALPADVFEDLLVDCPAVAERLVDAELLGELTAATHALRPLAVEANVGHLLVGDASIGTDPLVGAGPLLALKAGEWAADVVVEALRATDLSAARLGRWIPTFNDAQQRMLLVSKLLNTPGFDWKELLARFPAHRAGIANLFAGKVLEEATIQACDAISAWQNEQGVSDSPQVPNSV